MNDKNQTTKLPEIDLADLASVTGGGLKMRVGRSGGSGRRGSGAGRSARH
jgi:hypothetical protein